MLNERLHRTIAEAVIRDSAVIRALKRRGYKFTLLSSGYEAVARHPLADDGLFGPTLFTQLEGYVLPRTMFRMLPIAELTYVPQRGRTLWELKALGEYAQGRSRNTSSCTCCFRTRRSC